jgi:predicted transcriptional regulator
MSKGQRDQIIAERHALALEMRKHGYSYEQIAEHYECSPAAARSLVKTATEKAIKEPGQEVIDLELSRLDQLYRLSFNAALAGDTDAVSKCLSIMQRRAKYLGLDAPEKKEVTGANGGPMQVAALDLKGMSDGDLQKIKTLLLNGSK